LALVNPVVLDGSVTAERLGGLLDLGRESPDLDYKGACDLAKTQDLVELVKDVAAMMMAGGYLVIGADNRGKPTGALSSKDTGKFDEARLRSKLEKYIEGTITVSTQSHEIDGSLVVIIFVPPSPGGYAMCRCTGQYTDPGAKSPRVVFNKGDIFYRRGTSSARLDDDGFRLLLERQRTSIREEETAHFKRQLEVVRQEMAAAFGAQSIARGPAGALEVSMDQGLFDQAVIELMRQRDDIPVRRLLRTAPRLVSEAMKDDQWKDTVLPALDKIASVAAQALLYGQDDWFENVVAALSAVYATHASDEYSRTASTLFLAIVERVIALGGLAVRLQNWGAVRRLATERPPGMHSIYPTWLRHALTWGARMKLLTREEDGREITLSLIVEAQAVAKDLDCLHPDVAADDDALLSSLTQFDFLSCLVAVTPTDTQRSRSFYPNFARFYTERTEPIVEKLIADGQGTMRTMISPADDTGLADALALLNEVAYREAFAFAGWMGFRSPAILAFLEANASSRGDS